MQPAGPEGDRQQKHNRVTLISPLDQKAAIGFKQGLLRPWCFCRCYSRQHLKTTTLACLSLPPPWRYALVVHTIPGVLALVQVQLPYHLSACSQVRCLSKRPTSHLFHSSSSSGDGRPGLVVQHLRCALCNAKAGTCAHLFSVCQLSTYMQWVCEFESAAIRVATHLTLLYCCRSCAPQPTRRIANPGSGRQRLLL